MAFFPVSSGMVVQCCSCSIPSDTGPLIYLNGRKSADVLNKVKAGGRVVMPKLSLVMKNLLAIL
jgi:hypothetical protein